MQRLYEASWLSEERSGDYRPLARDVRWKQNPLSGTIDDATMRRGDAAPKKRSGFQAIQQSLQ